MALTNIRAFIERAITEADIIGRIKALKQSPPVRLSLVELPPDDKFWKKDHLNREDIPLTVESEDDKDPVLPLLTFFSGRDGYRTTHFTLSAPLELISGCNTLSWTLLTFTHEISHTVISGVLGEFLAKPSDSEDRFIPALSSLSLDKGGTNLFEQVRSLLCMGIWRMSGPNNKEKLDSSKFREYVRRNWHELNEILTSCFDFLYFYRATPERYIRSLWITWEAIPNIEDRIPEYITRCLCSLHTNNVRRDGGRDTSLNDFIDLLSVVNKELPQLKYTTTALNEITQNKQKYLKILKDRELLVKFVRHFLHSPFVEKIVMPEGRISRNTLNPLHFPRERLSSPLRYIEEISQDTSPNILKSLGILQRLAFMDLK